MSKLINNWKDLTIEQYQELNSIPKDYTFFQKQKEIIFILSNFLMTEEEIDDMDINEFNEVLKDIQWLSKQPQTSYKHDLNNYKIINIQNINLNDFIDIQTLISNNTIGNLHLIYAICYRKYRYNKFNTVVLEASGTYDIYERGNEFKSVSMYDVFGIIEEFIKVKDFIYSSYPHIFNPVFESEEDLSHIESEAERLEIEEEIKQEKIDASFGWNRLVYNLSNGNIRDYEFILQQPMIFIMNELTFRKNYKL